MTNYNFSICKLCHQEGNRIAYRLKMANVIVCKHCGFHYTDYLDDEYLPQSAHTEQITHIDEKAIKYIEQKLQSNPQRFHHHTQIVTQYVQQGENILDVGFGGAIFLRNMLAANMQAYGIELDRQYILYATEKLHLKNVYPFPIQDAFWQTNYAEFFNAIVLWDVLEHVNFPTELIHNAVNLLQPNGYIFIDTPCRNSFYHITGEWMSKLSFGYYNGFLHSMYSNHRFGHKQIFSKKDIQFLFQQSDIELIFLQQFHEISFPYEFYLHKIIQNKWLLKIAIPATKLFFMVFKVKNKMMIIGKRRSKK